ncbi:UvrD-helicase domain-containing protein [Silanimonas lenta]|uniref:UvrD-helicase domain-containing protein n=1 Tax=Silanimonas lenta TaxID=265429 RepID=UPI000404B0E2|nr:UvrD-helicase domain-containing protein [Silanimonas lenta]
MSPVTDWRGLPLAGRVLVEASAGTGKTWTLAALYLRLLLEGEHAGQRLLPERIAVATFTDAAAQELGERLRARLTQALEWSRHGAADATDPVGAWLLERWAAPGQRERDGLHLLTALARLDRAPIGTLHGLCYRLLREQPMESGLGFATPRLTEGEDLREALARDLLRHLGAGLTPPGSGPEAACLPEGLERFGILVGRVGSLLQPGARVSPPLDEATLRARFDAGLREPLRVLANRQHYKDGRSVFLKEASALLAFLEGEGPLPESVGNLAEASINSWVLDPARAVLEDPAFRAALAAIAPEFARAQSSERRFWAAWAPELRRWREQRARQANELSFDALIELAKAQVVAPGSPLPDALAARWPVALVDEFQDTDGSQYALLDRWFRDAAGTPRGLLVMVGDPKQAIYSFRGGDIGTYLRAARGAGHRLTLDTNRRSSTAYVAACNAFFEGPRAVLSADPGHDIRYRPVQAGGGAEAERLHEWGRPVASPLQVHALTEALPNAAARPRALAACAELVARLLTPGRYRLGAHGRPLAPGDLAVLLRTNTEIDDLRRLLQRRGIPCAAQSRLQVFESEAARDLLLVLHAVLHPQDVGALRAALLSESLGLGPRQLPALEAAGGLEPWRERLLDWRERWRREGVLAVVFALLEQARRRRGSDDERLATDLRHLGELLAAREAEGHSPGALLDWLRAQRLGEGEEADEGEDAGRGERRLRLESDQRRVRLMTLHASKGLEFPVVLLPTLWGAEARSSEKGIPLDTADTAGEREALFEKAARTRLAGAQQEERFRLLYVALTRAKQACHVFLLPNTRPAKRSRGAGTSKPKTDPARSPLDSLLDRGLEAACRASAEIAWHEGWPEAEETPGTATAPGITLASAAGPVVATAPAVPAPPPSESTDSPPGQRLEAEAPPPPGPFRLPGRWSFTGLVRCAGEPLLEAAAADDEALPAANDDAPEALETDSAGDGPGTAAAGLAPDAAHPPSRAAPEAALRALDAVRGTGFGNALHALLEAARPGECFAPQSERVLAALKQHGVRSEGGPPLAELAPRVAALLDRVRQTALWLPGHTEPLVLATLPAERQRHEMAFHLRLGDASLQALRSACERHGLPGLVPEGTPARIDGCLDGAIDLVFEHAGRVHVLDWKGNQLPQGGHPEALSRLMDHHHYRFQALLYTVALHRLLRQRRGAAYRIAEHLGAPVYLFLRAVGLGPGWGVWSERFPDALVETADALLAGEAEVAA